LGYRAPPRQNKNETRAFKKNWFEKKPLAPKTNISTTRAKPGGNSFSFKIQVPPGPTFKGTYLVFNQTISVPPGPAQEGTYLVFYHNSLYYEKIFTVLHKYSILLKKPKSENYIIIISV
jgi:hypothetical protein